MKSLLFLGFGHTPLSEPRYAMTKKDGAYFGGHARPANLAVDRLDWNVLAGVTKVLTPPAPHPS